MPRKPIKKDEPHGLNNGNKNGIVKGVKYDKITSKFHKTSCVPVYTSICPNVSEEFGYIGTFFSNQKLNITYLYIIRGENWYRIKSKNNIICYFVNHYSFYL